METKRLRPRIILMPTCTARWLFLVLLTTWAPWLAACASTLPPRPVALDPSNPAAPEAPAAVVAPLRPEPPVPEAPEPSPTPASPDAAPAHEHIHEVQAPPATAAAAPVGDASHAGHEHGAPATEPKVAPMFTCPMHAEVVSKQPARCPKCGMKLVPAKRKATTGAPQ